MASLEHITVCVCTYRRPALLRQLLECLRQQETQGQFTFSISVADNDSDASAREMVEAFSRTSGAVAAYAVEPRQNIALARNRALMAADRDWVAFIDDDEMPGENWLGTLLKTCQAYQADGVLGSAVPEYEGQPPVWVVRGKFYERARYPTGHEIHWRQGRTGNLLFKRSVLPPNEPPFREQFLTGEDHDFFRRAIERGGRFIWCDDPDATTREIIPAGRCRLSFMLRRALLRGKIAVLHPTWRRAELLKSLCAVPLYSVAAPVLLLGGRHRAADALIRLCDHLGLLLAWLGIDPIREKYVTR
jgi:glycosyltransferase involved in cell wall biosynthesis